MLRQGNKERGIRNSDSNYSFIIFYYSYIILLLYYIFYRVSISINIMCYFKNFRYHKKDS